jgi:TP901 family phage tail tape measure protein
VTDRTTKVSLVAEVSNYVAGLQKAAHATSAVSTEAEKLGKQKENIKQLGTAFLAVGTVAAIAVGLAVKEFTEFDAKMSLVKTLSHATGDEMHQLSEAALTMGQNIGFSATQVADAETELVKAGVSVKDIMGGALAGALQLASAGQIDVAKSTEIATIALTQFGLKGKDVPHVADLLAAGADKALGGVADLGEALKSGGLVAAQFGVSLDETVGTLSAFANAGLIGEVAGTDLRQMLLKLAAPSKQSSDDMKALGISLYDSAGRFVGITSLAGQLHDKLSKLSEAQRNQTLATLFGARAIAGANVLYKEGAKGIADWTNKVNDQGFAAQQASGKMDNLQGDVKKLSAAFNVDLIRAGSAANGPLRDIAKTVTGLLKLFSDLPVPVQQGAIAVALIAAAAGLAGGAFLLGVPKVLAFAGALESVGAVGLANTLQSTVGFLAGPWGIALTVAATLLGGAFVKAQADAAARVQELTDTLDKQTGAITKNTRATTVKQLRDDGVIELANKLGVSLTTVTDAALGNKDAVKSLVDQQAKWNKEGGHTAAELTQHGILWQNLAGKIGVATVATKQSQRDAQNNARAMGVLRDATRSVADATSKASAAVAKNGKTLDSTTVAGRENQTALDAVANAQHDVIDATELSTSSQVKTTAAWQAGRKALYAVAAQMGLTGAAADDYVNNHLGRIPPVVSTLINVDNSAALAQIAEISATYARLQAQFNSGQNIIVRPGGPKIANADGGLYAYADGGFGAGVYSGGTPMYKFAEKETGWEAFISGKPGKERENRATWVDAGRRLGALPSGGSGSTSVSLEGAILQGTIDGQPFQFMIQKQIAAASSASKTKLQNGKQTLQF